MVFYITGSLDIKDSNYGLLGFATMQSCIPTWKPTFWRNKRLYLMGRPWSWRQCKTQKMTVSTFTSMITSNTICACI